MTTTPAASPSWEDAIRSMAHPRVITMLFLGLSAGIPILLIFSSLSLWLGEAGVEKKAVTFFSWAALGYSFKFVWAPLIDKLPFPFLTKALGRRRGWMLVSQFMVIIAIALMAFVDPSVGKESLTMMALAAVLLGFSSATQDIVIDAYRIESAETRLQAMMSSAYIAGYRVGMIVAGAGALYLAAAFGSTKEVYVYSAWQSTYLIMSGMMLIGVITTLLIPEPEQYRKSEHHYATRDYLRLVVVFAGAVFAFIALFVLSGEPFKAAKQMMGNDALMKFLLEVIRLFTAVGAALVVGWLLVKVGVVSRQMAYDTWIAPLVDFFQRYGLQTALLLLALIGLYRISDIVLGVISNVFYQDMGFSKPEIATAVKTVGVIVAIVGGFLGGLLATRFGVMRILMLGAILAALTNLVFVALAYAGHDLTWMYIAVIADNLAAGLASAAFVAFLSSLTSVSFTAVQYAIFSSLMTLIPKVLGGYSGSIVENIGYPQFFIFTALIGLPVLWLVWLAGKHLDLREETEIASSS